MDYAVVCLIGVLGGGFAVFIALDAKRKNLDKQHREQEVQAERIRNDSRAIAAKQQDIEQLSAKLAAEHKELSARVISFQELQNENAVLKRDLKNLDQNVRKLALDRERQRQTQETLGTKVDDLGNRYLKENVKWIGNSLNPNNFSACKQRLQDVIERCRGVGFDVSAEVESDLLADLQEEYRNVVRAAFEREEQARIKAQMREELKREKENKTLSASKNSLSGNVTR